MTHSGLQLTRRRVVATAFAVVPTVCIAGIGTTGIRQSLQDRLLQDLASIPLPTPDATLQLTRFGVVQDRGMFLLNAVVQMDWQPGQRRRSIVAQGQDLEMAYDDIIKAIDATFAQA